MCTLALYFHRSRRYPLVVAANRDEFLDRPATAPTCIHESPWVVAGLDLTAGGTWFGVNQYGLLVGLLNRRTAAPVDPLRRSRGLLCLETLDHTDVAGAMQAVSAGHADDYNPFNLLVASPESAFVAQNIGGQVRVTHLEPGLHLLTNLDLNDPTCPRIAKSHSLFEAAGEHLDRDDPQTAVARLRAVLSDHSTPLDPRTIGPPNNLCVHLGPYGTRSSSVAIYSAADHRWRFFYADGPPCTHPYAELVLPHRGRPAGSGQPGSDSSKVLPRDGGQ